MRLSRGVVNGPLRFFRGGGKGGGAASPLGGKGGRTDVAFGTTFLSSACNNKFHPSGMALGDFLVFTYLSCVCHAFWVSMIHIIARQAEDLIVTLVTAHLGTGRSAQVAMAAVSSFDFHPVALVSFDQDMKGQNEL